MRRSFTLIELIIVVIIVTFLSLASYKAIENLLIRSYKAKELTRLSLESQVALDQISSLLSQRIHSTVIGYRPSDGDFQKLEDTDEDSNYTILEWIAKDYELDNNYTGFLDMLASLKNDKFVVDSNLSSGLQRELFFAGSFDRGDERSNIHNAYGWHGTEHTLSYDVEVDSDHNLTLLPHSPKPKYIYEKYYLAKTAYAIARGANIDQNADCINSFNIKDINNTLFLFYDYQPWEGETFCADPHSGNRQGKATILAQNIGGFHAFEEDYTIRVVLDVNKTIRGTKVGVHFTKMKVVF